MGLFFFSVKRGGWEGGKGGGGYRPPRVMEFYYIIAREFAFFLNYKSMFLEPPQPKKNALEKYNGGILSGGIFLFYNG